MATPEEVEQVTTVKIGAVPPFGNLFHLNVFMDKSVLENEYIFFSAGTHNDSIKMKAKDYVIVVQPVVIDMSM